jgi:hypothetical protein
VEERNSLPLSALNEDAALRTILEGTATETGERFFEALVENLAKALNTQGAWVTEYLEGSRGLRSLAFWMGGEWVRDYQYDLAGTPCEPVIDVPSAGGSTPQAPGASASANPVRNSRRRSGVVSISSGERDYQANGGTTETMYRAHNQRTTLPDAAAEGPTVLGAQRIRDRTTRRGAASRVRAVQR